MKEKQDEVIAVLDGAEYWEWRTSIEEMEHAKTRVELAHARYKVLELSQQIGAIQLNQFKTTVSNSLSAQADSKTSYDAHVKKIEEKYGIELKGCIIGDIDYEVIRPA